VIGAKRLYDFSNPQATVGWTAVNDVVMGGISSGGMGTTEHGTALFAGRVSLENNGGFASVRSRLRRCDLGAYSGVTMRFCGDGRRYKLDLKTDSPLDGILYRTPFETSKGEWQTRYFPFSKFKASFRGRRFAEAPPLDPARITSIGVLISDKQAGQFRLEIAWIAAFSAGDQEPP
jgi:monofunctional biosynthetic peptidoglycan transglycosylase